ncbi:uncharacterized protein TrAFT101_010118 [Trichoderma asperellum]|uniref:uncharacterized protein n=1 Tax=Trichoderma asperellum TaxID=101201 RepID=UPI0033214902|nr:hypothetical protein TrAFT101_010118 [Trichoderma asperellum]
MALEASESTLHAAGVWRPGTCPCGAAFLGPLLEIPPSGLLVLGPQTSGGAQSHAAAATRCDFVPSSSPECGAGSSALHGHTEKSSLYCSWPEAFSIADLEAMSLPSLAIAADGLAGR